MTSRSKSPLNSRPSFRRPAGHIAPGRISLLFLLSVFGAYKAGRIDPAQVARELEALEKGETTGLKPPIQNRHPPLKGLWHKHYMQPGMASLAMNIQHGLKQFGIPYLQQKVREAQQAGEERYFTIEDVAPLANDAVHGDWRRLREMDRLTGEWIVFARHEGRNYYLISEIWPDQLILLSRPKLPSDFIEAAA